MAGPAAEDGRAQRIDDRLLPPRSRTALPVIPRAAQARTVLPRRAQRPLARAAALTVLLRDILANLCKRIGTAEYCTTADRFTQYLALRP